MNPILIDCDDVCIDLLGAWINELNKRYNLSYTPEDIKTWNIAIHMPELERNQIFEVLKEESFYKNLEPINESQIYLNKLIDNDYPIRIVTAHDYHSIKFKMDRFFELFPFLRWEHIIVAKDKSIINGSCMIDDNYENLISNKLVNKKILFKQYHNSAHHMDKTNIDHITCSWHDIYRFIEYHFNRREINDIK